MSDYKILKREGLEHHHFHMEEQARQERLEAERIERERRGIPFYRTPSYPFPIVWSRDEEDER